MDGPIIDSLLSALVVDADVVVSLENLVDIGSERDPRASVRRQLVGGGQQRVGWRRFVFAP
jgi:hypothetical protein